MKKGVDEKAVVADLRQYFHHRAEEQEAWGRYNKTLTDKGFDEFSESKLGILKEHGRQADMAATMWKRVRSHFDGEAWELGRFT